MVLGTLLMDGSGALNSAWPQSFADRNFGLPDKRERGKILKSEAGEVRWRWKKAEKWEWGWDKPLMAQEQQGSTAQMFLAKKKGKREVRMRINLGMQR